MSNSSTTLYDLLKKIAVQAESEINNYIKNELDNKDVIALLNKELLQHKELRKLFRRLQQLTLSNLHLPNKDDMANVTNLIIQLEEKVDGLEERLANLLDDFPGKKIETKFELKNELANQLNDKTKQKLEKIQMIMGLFEETANKGKKKNEEE